ncbi:MAG TPA: hypothetical protein VGK24_03650 [Candidatus Angelobacter sp.]|jgi:hypothetical protein
MNRLSALDALSPAFARVGAMLFQPFRVKTWLKIGFIGFLGGGLATASGGFNFRMPAFPNRLPQGQLPPEAADISRAIRSIHIADYFHIIVIVLAVGLVTALIFQYLFCRFRFILFDAVITGQAEIGRGWRHYALQANRYFGFWLVYRLASWAVIIWLIGVPLWHAYKNGLFSGDNSLSVFLGFFASIALKGLLIGLCFAIISTLAKDFVLPVLALDDLSIEDAWTAVWRVAASEPGAWAAYMVLKFFCAIGASIILGIAIFIVALPALLVIGIPAGILFLLGALAFKVLGLAAAIIVCGIAALLTTASFLCVFLVLIAPISIFFASFAFYFFGGRYPKLAALLWPQPLPPAPHSVTVQPTLP